MSPAAMRRDVAGPEWQALELITRGLPDDATRERFRALIEDSRCDPAELYAQAFAHRIVPLLGYHLQQTGADRALPKLYRFELAQAYYRQTAQTELLTAEAWRITDALLRADVPVACAKGVVIANVAYEAPGARSMNDIDVMARPRDARAVDLVMRELGYVIGDFSWRERAVVPIDRRLELQYRVYADHIPQYARATGEPVQPAFVVDFSHTFTWVKSRWQVDLDSALRSAIRQPDGLPVLDPLHQFLRIALHIFREAWLEHWIVREQNDITLRKIADVLRFWERHRAELGGGRLGQAARALAVAEPVAWVLGHVDAVCATDLLQQAELQELASERWLASAAGGNEAPLRWHGDMRRRLHDREPVRLEHD